MAVISHRAEPGQYSGHALRLLACASVLLLSSGCAMIIGHGNAVDEATASHFPVQQRIHADQSQGTIVLLERFVKRCCGASEGIRASLLPSEPDSAAYTFNGRENFTCWRRAAGQYSLHISSTQQPLQKTLTLNAGDIIYLALDTERTTKPPVIRLTEVSTALGEYHVQKALDDQLKPASGYSGLQLQQLEQYRAQQQQHKLNCGGSAVTASQQGRE